MDFHPETRNVEVSFNLASSQDVNLTAYDSQGRVVAVLLDGSQSAGAHRLSVFSNRMNTVSGACIFKLKVGDQVTTHTWMSL